MILYSFEKVESNWEFTYTWSNFDDAYSWGIMCKGF